MKPLKYLLVYICYLTITSCSSPIDKSISEALTNDEIVSICKKHKDPKLHKLLGRIASTESLGRKMIQGDIVKYADVTYNDYIEQFEIFHDSVRINNLSEKYAEYSKSKSDSVWTKLLSICDVIKNDTSLNNYAKLHYELNDPKFNSAKLPKGSKYFSLVVDSHDTSLESFGGIVSKISRKEAKDTVVGLYFFSYKAKKPSFSLFYNQFIDDPAHFETTTDFKEENYDYAINILWIKKKDLDIEFSSKEQFELLRKNRDIEGNQMNRKVLDYNFNYNNIVNHKSLLKITNVDFIPKSKYIKTYLNEEMKMKNAKAFEFFEMYH